MIAGVVIVIGVLFLSAQFMDSSATMSLASEFQIPANKEFTSWTILDRPLHAIIFDVPVGCLLLLAGGGIYWISDWFNEKVGWQFEGAPAARTIDPEPSVPVTGDQKS